MRGVCMWEDHGHHPRQPNQTFAPSQPHPFHRAALRADPLQTGEKENHSTTCVLGPTDQTLPASHGRHCT